MMAEVFSLPAAASAAHRLPETEAACAAARGTLRPGAVADHFLVVANMLRVLDRLSDMAAFVRLAVAEVPGVAHAEVVLDAGDAPARDPQWDWVQAIVGGGTVFGHVCLTLSDRTAFQACAKPLVNLIALIGQELQSRARLARAEQAEARLKALLDTAEGKLAEQQNQARALSQIARRTHNGVIVTDAEGRVTWVNDSFTRITGYTLEEMAGRSPGAVLQGERTDPEASEAMSRARCDGTPCRVEIANYTKDGRELWLDIEIVPVRDETGRIEAFIAIETDVTETKQTLHALHEAKQEAEAANMAKSAFLAQMSHELRTPLNGILGFSELLAAPGLPLGEAKRQEYASDIHGAATHLHTLLSDLLNVSALEAGRLKLASDPVALDEALAETLRGFRADIESRALVVERDGGRRALVQILYNLVSNALKHVPDGGRLAISARPDGLGHLAIAVEDDGPGLPEEKMAELFEPFATIGDPLLTRQSGTGLGLSIVRGLTQAQGGSIRAGASRWGGAAITVVLPLAG
jgi:hypothetical protein